MYRNSRQWNVPYWKGEFMLCYKDRWWCQFWSKCKHGEHCDRAATDEVYKKASECGLYIDIRSDQPDCFEHNGSGSKPLFEENS